MANEEIAKYAKQIYATMCAGDMEKVTQIYGVISAVMAMEEAQKLEQMIAFLSNQAS